MIIMDKQITEEGAKMIQELVGGKLMDDGIWPLMNIRGDIDHADKAIIFSKFSRKYLCFFKTSLLSIITPIS